MPAAPGRTGAWKCCTLSSMGRWTRTPVGSALRRVPWVRCGGWPIASSPTCAARCRSDGLPSACGPIRRGCWSSAQPADSQRINLKCHAPALPGNATTEQIEASIDDATHVIVRICSQVSGHVFRRFEPTETAGEDGDEGYQNESDEACVRPVEDRIQPAIAAEPSEGSLDDPSDFGRNEFSFGATHLVSTSIPRSCPVV